MRLVVVESPFKAETKTERDRNIVYARRALHDCFVRGEAPFASHLLYTQEGVLWDANPAERKLGIEAGLEWAGRADCTVVYVDLGITAGMQQGINDAHKYGRAIEYRRIGQFTTPAPQEEDND
jgi:hypothetical protein